jgi:hypothetical protein
MIRACFDCCKMHPFCVCAYMHVQVFCDMYMYIARLHWLYTQEFFFAGDGGKIFISNIV